MAFTYSLTDLATPLAQIRRKIGDTNSADPILSDEEIEQVIAERPGSVSDQAVECIRNAIAKWSRDVDRSNLGMSATRSQKVQHLRDLLVEMKGQVAATAAPLVGGISIARRDELRDDSDFVGAAFRRGQHSINETTGADED